MLEGNGRVMPSQDLNKDMDEIISTHPGLSIRQLFAAMAMQGLISQDNSNDKFKEGVNTIATISVHMADALIAELNKLKNAAP